MATQDLTKEQLLELLNNQTKGKVLCECGSYISMRWQSQHLSTKTHSINMDKKKVDKEMIESKKKVEELEKKSSELEEMKKEILKANEQKELLKKKIKERYEKKMKEMKDEYEEKIQKLTSKLEKYKEKLSMGLSKEPEVKKVSEKKRKQNTEYSRDHRKGTNMILELARKYDLGLGSNKEIIERVFDKLVEKDKIEDDKELTNTQKRKIILKYLSDEGPSQRQEPNKTKTETKVDELEKLV